MNTIIKYPTHTLTTITTIVSVVIVGHQMDTQDSMCSQYKSQKSGMHYIRDNHLSI